MTTTIITNNSNYPYGMMSNRVIGKMMSLHTEMTRLKDAIATASASYEGVEGTQFEVGNPTAPPAGTTRATMAPNQNLFGVVASDTPGEQGTAYRYAMDQLAQAWVTFWAAAQPYVEQLDNGQQTM